MNVFLFAYKISYHMNVFLFDCNVSYHMNVFIFGYNIWYHMAVTYYIIWMFFSLAITFNMIWIFFLLQDVNDYYSLRYPKLYQPGLVNLLFNKKLFLLSAGEGFLTSIVLFFIPYGAFYWGVSPWGTDLADLQSFGVVIASILVVAVNIRVSTSQPLYNSVAEVQRRSHVS